MAIPSKAFLEKKLKGIKEYVGLFKAAYPSDKDPLTYLNIQKSIGAFERTLVTPSPFDNYLRNDYAALDADQKAGLKTFIDVGCIQCHNGIAIGGASFQKFGVHGDYRTFTHSTSNDEGRKKITKQESDKDFFKVPSLRNVAKTFPYFHDGSISDLKDAVLIMGKTQLNKDLTEVQVKEIVAFLNSLTGNLPDDAKNPAEILAQK
jgi:cytochrome c peroxidase